MPGFALTLNPGSDCRISFRLFACLYRARPPWQLGRREGIPVARPVPGLPGPTRYIGPPSRLGILQSAACYLREGFAGHMNGKLQQFKVDFGMELCRKGLSLIIVGRPTT